MAAKRRSRPDERARRAPAWIRDEPTVRRIMRMRTEGHTWPAVAKACEVSMAGLERMRWIGADPGRALARGAPAGEVAVCAAIAARCRTGTRQPRPALFTPEEGKLLAKDIERWKL